MLARVIVATQRCQSGYLNLRFYVRVAAAKPPRSRAQSAGITPSKLGLTVVCYPVQCPHRTPGCHFVPPSLSRIGRSHCPPFLSLLLPLWLRVSALSHLTSVGFTPAPALNLKSDALTSNRANSRLTAISSCTFPVHSRALHCLLLPRAYQNVNHFPAPAYFSRSEPGYCSTDRLRHAVL